MLDCESASVPPPGKTGEIPADGYSCPCRASHIMLGTSSILLLPVSDFVALTAK